MKLKGFSDENIRDHRLIFCPNCNSEFFSDASEEEIVCEECGETITSEEEDFENFVWHPSERY